jgi:uncharacterized membrane protein YoaK (UPF0700 family)
MAMLESPPPYRKATILLLLVIAGAVDAFGLGELGRFFVSFMSGNTTLIGVDIAARDYADALMPLGLIALFVAGATIGTLVAEASGRRAAGAILLAEAVLLALAYAGLVSARPLAGTIVLPVAMGLANIVTLQNGGPRPGTTYATGALVKLGIALAGLGRDTDPRDALFYAAMWLALLIGATAGAIGRVRFGAEMLFAPIAVLVLLGVAALVLVPRRAA